MNEALAVRNRSFDLTMIEPTGVAGQMLVQQGKAMVYQGRCRAWGGRGRSIRHGNGLRCGTRNGAGDGI
ncbi:hypothetical protein [Bradyrhizobium jicamae]|uniref:hypothetical protein n=1 Tax=Bradyrhizobium jicamae TaxID=280332 RepID=UPI001BA66EE6|nr:hypothetical protein [Bradyrhizobium jicamae]MBR0938521.1 hypothetical protein [Bradyrhizobium jicamae]